MFLYLTIRSKRDKTIKYLFFGKYLLLIILIFYPIDQSFGQTLTSQFRSQSTRESFNPNDPPETRIQIAPYLTFGAQIEIEGIYEHNYDLDKNEKDDVFTLVPELSLALSFDPNRHIQIFANLVGNAEFVWENGRNNDEYTLEFEQLYILFKNLVNDMFAIQLGRQRFEDERQWLYEAELDGARLFFLYDNLFSEFSVSRGGLVDRDLLNDDVSDKIDNYIFNTIYEFGEDTLAGIYLIYRNDTTEENESPFFVGFHSEAEVTDELEFWADVAYVTGESGSNDISGFGLDIGLVYAFDIEPEPYFTIAYAFGTGDSDPEDGKDKNFRQTGLQGNESDYNGVVDFKYYGEVFDPELSNMSIFTAAIGINPNEETSIDLIYHYYRQSKASEELREIGIDAEPNGKSKDLGSEIDLILGYEGFGERVAVGLFLGYFIPGDAFPSDSGNAFLTKIIMEYEF